MDASFSGGILVFHGGNEPLHEEESYPETVFPRSR
jgi:hypothetical protein